MSEPPDVLRMLHDLAKHGYKTVRVCREIGCPPSTMSMVRNGHRKELSYERQEALKQIYAKVCQS